MTTTFVLDASALIRFLDNEAGADRVEELLRSGRAGRCLVMISAVNWGEVVGIFHKRSDVTTASRLLQRFTRYNLQIVSATADRAARSAKIKQLRQIPYADCFGVELASNSPDHILVTADFDVKPAEHDITIEFLPTKPKP